MPAYDECETEESPKKLIVFPHINLNQYDPRNKRRKEIYETYTKGLTLPVVSQTPTNIVEQKTEEVDENTDENAANAVQANTNANANATGQPVPAR